MLLKEVLHRSVYYDNLPMIRLDEATYKEIKSLLDDDFLKQKEREKQLDSSRFIGMAKDTSVFAVPSSNYAKNGIIYTNRIQFVDFYEQASDLEFTPRQIADLLVSSGDIKVHCTCPSFLYHGYQYLATSIESSIMREPRKPVIKNPDERGIVCKHLRRTLEVLPFYTMDIARSISNYRRTL